MGGKGRERRGLAPRNDALTTCKAVTLRGGHRVKANRQRKRLKNLCFSCISFFSFGTEIAGETKPQPC